MLTSKIEVYQGLSEWGCGSREEVDTRVSDVGAVAQVQGAQLRSVAQQEPQGGISQLQACQAQLCHPLQPPTAFRLPWAGRGESALLAPPTLHPGTQTAVSHTSIPLHLSHTCSHHMGASLCCPPQGACSSPNFSQT